MGRSLVKWLLLGLIVLVHLHGHRGCFEEERMGLLEIKEEFVRSTPNATIRDYLPPSRVYILPSWIDDHKSECCEWERVTCNSTTGHVTHLSLHNIWEFDIEPDESYYYFFHTFDFNDMVWLLNVSLFESFKELRSLDLSFNAIGGWIEHKGMLIYIISLFLIICNLSYVNISFGQQIDRYRRKNKTQRTVIFLTSTLLHRSLLFSSLAFVNTASLSCYLLIYVYVCLSLNSKFFFFFFFWDLDALFILLCTLLLIN